MDGIKMEQQKFQVYLFANKGLNMEFNEDIFGIGF